MGERWDQFLTNLGTQSSPFGFAPGVDPKTAGMNVIGGIGTGMLANITKNPLEAFGASYQQQMADSRDQSRDALSAKVVMDQVEEKKRERAAKQERAAQMERAIGMLPPNQQALARMLPEKFFGEQIQSQFSTDKPGLEITDVGGKRGVLNKGMRRIERIEQQQSPITPEGFGLIQQIFRSGSIPVPSRKEFPSMLRRVMDQIDGRARLIPGDPQIISKGVYQ